MSKKNLVSYINARVAEHLPELTLWQIQAIVEYDEWLDRVAEQRDAPIHAEQIFPSCNGTGADPMSDITNWLPCQKCAGKSNRSAGG